MYSQIDDVSKLPAVRSATRSRVPLIPLRQSIGKRADETPIDCLEMLFLIALLIYFQQVVI